MNINRKKGILYLIIASVLWSIGGLFIKIIDWNPMAIAGTRSGIAAIIMLIYIRKPVKKLSRIKWLGACSYASLLILFVAANKLTTSANAILLEFTSPIWVALFSCWFLKKRTSRSDWITILVVMFGMTLFFIGDVGNGHMFGNFIAVLSGIAMAILVLILKHQDNNSPIEITLIGNILTFGIGLPFFFLSVPDLKSILALLVLGVFQLGISYIFYTLAIRYVSAIEAILIPILEPLLNPVWVFVVTGEIPGSFALVGGAIVIIAIISRGIYNEKVLKNASFTQSV